ncbi:MAG TPA: hypothetical protein VHT52_23970 [Stellaceae bacterium]|jgi:hypothetical protein|nr:hypothetical protein [Stellaceae bacterium]
MAEEVYLGDGLYASFESDWLGGGMIKLRAPRIDGADWVGLEPAVFRDLLRYADHVGWGELIDKHVAARRK